MVLGDVARDAGTASDECARVSVGSWCWKRPKTCSEEVEERVKEVKAEKSESRESVSERRSSQRRRERRSP